MNRYPSLIIRFFRKPLAEQLIFSEAVFWLALTRMATLILPFKWIARFLGTHMVESVRLQSTDQTRRARHVASCIRAMSRHLPWDCKCLVQAISAKMMLDRRSIPTTLYLGVSKDQQDEMIAHAWLRAGNAIVLGGGGLKQFTVVSTFS